MKKIIIAIIALTLVAGVASAVSPSIKKVVEQAVEQAALTSEAVRLQADTNDTTTVTGIVPSAVGQILVGQTGAGTNSIWIAVGLTTNDWVKVSAE